MTRTNNTITGDNSLAFAASIEGRCPLCHSNETQLVEQLPAQQLADSYRRVFGYNPINEFADTRMIDYRHCDECDLRFFHPALAGAESLYDVLRMHLGANYYMQTKPEYDIAQPWITRGQTVLDIGCGVGAFAASVPESRYTGLELNSGALAAARRLRRNVINETIEAHSLKHPGQYDVVCSFQVLEHVCDIRGFLAGCLRALTPSGLLIVCVPSFDSYLRFQTNALLNLPPHHLSHWSDRCLRQIAETFPLRLEALEHELLADVHRDSYAATLVSTIFGGHQRLLNTSRANRFLTRVYWKLGKVLSKALQAEPMRPRGHSVVASYRKLGEVDDI
jgi:2-polyprenyl-3-methyl-5-hydroxy-6-metoxy-1,4-benzoquinol methylase